MHMRKRPMTSLPVLLVFGSVQPFVKFQINPPVDHEFESRVLQSFFFVVSRLDIVDTRSSNAAML